MSSANKLNQSLDEIMKDGAGNRPARRNARRVAKTKATAAVAPSGGVKKLRKDNKPSTTVAAPAAKAPKSLGSNKIIVSGLPSDVAGDQLKDYFGKTVGMVKKVSVSYDHKGHSRGVAEIIFSTADFAEEAARSLDGVKIDGRPMKVEVVLGARDLPPPKTLQDRISKPKSAAKDAPKPATKGRKPAGNGVAATSAKSRPVKKSGRVGKPKAKSAAELDQEMSDYFVGANGTAPAAAAAAATTNGGQGSAEDQVM